MTATVKLVNDYDAATGYIYIYYNIMIYTNNILYI